MYFDLIFGYKIMFGLVRVKFEDSFLHHRKEDMLTNCIKLVIAIPLAEFFFAERVVNIWNFLPVPCTVDFSSLVRFRRTFESVDFTDFRKRSLR